MSDQPRGEGTPEDEIACAVSERSSGDLANAIAHVASALASDPTRVEWLELADSILAAGDDPLRLTPATPGTFFGIVALRARALAQRKRHAEALDVLLDVVRFRPAIPYLRWAASWVRAPGVVASLSAPAIESLATKLAELADALPPNAVRSAGARANIEAALEVVRALRDKHPEHDRLAFLASVLSRKIGRYDEAVRLAKEWFEARPSWVSAVELANAYRESGDARRAVELYERALAFSPEDLTARLDIADTLLDDGQLEAAASAYGRVLERDPDHPWARPSLAYALYLAEEDESRRAELEALARKAGAPGRATELLQDLSLFRTTLPRPRDPIADEVAAAIAAIERHRGTTTESAPGEVRVACPFLPAPSIAVAFDLAMKGLGEHYRLTLEVREVENPDPRTPRGAIAFLLWSFDGTRASPALPRPPGAVAAAVGRIARTRFDSATWERAAGGEAKALGSAAIVDLLAVMTQPGMPESGIHPFLWVQRVQVAAALVIACMDGSWQVSERRAALFSVARGPVDWTVAASVVALTRVAMRDAGARAEIESLFAELLDAATTRASVAYEYPLVANWLLLPGIGAERKRALFRKKRRIERDA